MKKLEVVSADQDGITIYRVGAEVFTSIPYQRMEKFNQPVRKENKVKDRFTSQQKKLYKQVMYGLSAYHPEDLQKMTSKEKKVISVNYAKAQRVITIYKNKCTNSLVSKMMKAWFPKSELAKEFCSKKISDLNSTNKLNFKHLGITPYAMATILVAEEVLPHNFFSL